MKRRFFAILALLTCALVSVAAQQSENRERVRVTGIVTSEEGEPLIGVAVIESSATGSGVMTDIDGAYEISVQSGSELSFQAMSFETYSFTVPTGSSEVKCNVKLKSDSQLLEETVVVAYGVKKKGTITGSVSSVKSDKIESTPTAAFDQALQGQVPGLSVIATSGEPSVSAKLLIRGTNSINSGTDPLYILDGAEISSADFNTINPSDIENISVLKDASSTSIYGARAANGVVVITTKRGRMAEKPVINFRTQLGSVSYTHLTLPTKLEV